MSEDIVSQCIDQLCDNDFAIQVDESRDISKMSHLFAYVRYMWNKEIKEDFLFCKELKRTTKSDDIFKLIDDFMTGKHSGVVQKIKAFAPHTILTHCFFH
ncbi:unnamed protein product [Natator depressus]